ncbi:MAG: hypothetical protein AAGG44_19275, partial [Planctomycetota bacterium]
IPLIFMYENRDVFGSWRQLGWILPVVILWYGFKAVRNLFTHYRLRREGIQQYGLLLDGENLVVHNMAMLDPWCCVCIPRANIHRFFCNSEGSASGGGYNGIALKVAYTDAKGSPRSLKLGSNSSFERPPYVLDKLLTEFPSGLTRERQPSSA